MICLIDEIISRISQNDLHILHNGHICQTCKIIRVNIELAILAFILPTSGHANFECQQHPSLKPTQLAGSSPVATFRAHKCRMRLLCCCKIRQAELTVHDVPCAVAAAEMPAWRVRTRTRASAEAGRLAVSFPRLARPRPERPCR